jgi:pantetheine-phosphate adenylyltransferase
MRQPPGISTTHDAGHLRESDTGDSETEQGSGYCNELGQQCNSNPPEMALPPYGRPQARLTPLVKCRKSNEMPVKALYPGTFDPPTNGHVDLIQRGSRLFDQLTVGILVNPVKNPLFTVSERVEMLQEATGALKNVTVATFNGLMVDFAREQGVSAVLRGIRAISDYEHEFQMALMNRRLAPEIETVFLQPAGRYSFVSSRMVKEVFSFGGDVTGLVPANVLKRLRERIQNGA